MRTRKRAGAGLKITGDLLRLDFAFWSIRTVPAPKDQSEQTRPLIADTDQARTVQQMASAWKNITREIPVDDVALPVDPDDYPLF